MFGQLLESGSAVGRGDGRRGGTMVSIAVHAAVILLAVLATGRAAPSPPPAPDEALTPTYVPPPPEAPGGPLVDGGIVDHRAAAPRPLPRPPLPYVDLNLPALPTGDRDVPFAPIAGDFSTATSDHGAPTGAVVHGRGGLHAPGEPIDAPMAEKAALPLEGNAPPAYPPLLREAGIEGSTLVEFIIDAAGRVRPGSIRTLETDHPAFADAVRRALVTYRYLPAEAGGRRVAVRVRQRFVFALQR